MKNEIKDYVEKQLQEVFSQDEIGFLILNRFKKTNEKWPFVDCDVKIINFNSPHTIIEKIDGKLISGKDNSEKLDNYVSSYRKDGEYVSRVLMWRTHTLKERLTTSAQHNTINKTIPNLDKKTYTKEELQNVCNVAKKINYEEYKKANDRAQPIARRILWHQTKKLWMRTNQNTT